MCTPHPYFSMQSSVFGELGSGAELDESAAGFENEPVAVAGGHAFAALSAGFSHTCGITLNSSAGGSLLCWGESPGNGQGLSPRTLLNEPTQPAWAADTNLAFVAVSAADDSTCALDDAGNVWCFGARALKSSRAGHCFASLQLLVHMLVACVCWRSSAVTAL